MIQIQTHLPLSTRRIFAWQREKKRNGMLIRYQSHLYTYANDLDLNECKKCGNEGQENIN